MTFSPDMAAKRFGYGLSPKVPAPQSTAEMLDLLRGPDRMATVFGIGSFYDLQSQYTLYERFRLHARDNPGTPEGKASDAKKVEVGNQTRELSRGWFAQLLSRRINTQDGFRERLVAFWADHFTARGKRALMREGTSLYIEDAVRPHVTGRFVDLLMSAVRHPLMLHYLDQEFSVGPNSRNVRRRRPDRGLNENLAREVLELHTLGVDGPYDQTDVRALANLFTGLSRTRDFSFRFRRGFAEPGPQEVLGVQYSGEISMARIETVLGDLAAHPATAAHVARKLAVHFVADQPPEDLVAALTQSYLDSDGDLMALYATLLDHPASWAQPATNIRPPEEFISAAMRALAVSPDVLSGMDKRVYRRAFQRPLRLMGQDWQRPAGPDGWAEEDSAWVTPQGIAGRMEWAMQAPKVLLKTLPDPRDVVLAALGPEAPQKVVFAASAAESRAEAIGLIFISPAFQRR